MRPAVRFFQLSSLLVALTALAGGAHAAVGDSAAQQAGLEVDCTRFPLVDDGSRRQTFDAFDATSGIAALPPRIVSKLLPGQQDTYCIGFQNRGTKPIDLKVAATNLSADDAGLPTAELEAADRGTAKWLTLPTTKVEGLGSGEIAWLTVRVRVPDDALAGSNYASVVASGEAESQQQEGSNVQAVPNIVTQLFFDIPGNATRQGKVTDIRSPRVIWWDGFGLGDVPVLDKLRGLGVASVRFGWKNTGDFTSDIGGRVRITSDLSGKSVATLDVPEQVVLRDSERQFEITWKDDIPLVGRFTPVLEVTGDSGRVEKHELDPIWVIPSWWYIVLLALAIAIPVWWRRRSRQRYEELLARVEAAEARGADAEFDEDAWDGDDEWTPRA